jgi:hypothetical protein
VIVPGKGAPLDRLENRYLSPIIGNLTSASCTPAMESRTSCGCVECRLRAVSGQLMAPRFENRATAPAHPIKRGSLFLGV